ncbi:MAG: hemerythrin domain-containing protein [Bacteroidales bacterium]|nr:hemerythrin domain-containing protein [Bacteroidales bacterium]
MKLADIIAANHNVILLLPRFGIPLGFGEKSVREVCASSGVPEDFMLLICNLYTFEDYLPLIDELSEIDMSPLVPYLKASHRYYTEERLPHIGAHIDNIAGRIDNRYGKVFQQFYADFRNQIEEHFSSEERYEFARVLALQQGASRRGLMKGTSKRSHPDLVDKLNDLTQIVYKYLPGNVLPEETMELVFDILQLSSDIQKHALIEDKILQPYMQWLERRGK